MNIQSKIQSVKMIRNIPPELFDQGYQYFSFDVISFTNVPLNKTTNIILEQVYKEKLYKVTKEHFKEADKRLFHYWV